MNEILGVFAKLDLYSRRPEDGLFESTIDLAGLIKIEKLLRRLAPPKWPEDVLGAIDRAKAAEGAKLFVENCSECHSVWPHRWAEAQGQTFHRERACTPRYRGHRSDAVCYAVL